MGFQFSPMNQVFMVPSFEVFTLGVTMHRPTIIQLFLHIITYLTLIQYRPIYAVDRVNHTRNYGASAFTCWNILNAWRGVNQKVTDAYVKVPDPLGTQNSSESIMCPFHNVSQYEQAWEKGHSGKSLQMIDRDMLNRWE